MENRENMKKIIKQDFSKNENLIKINRKITKQNKFKISKNLVYVPILVSVFIMTISFSNIVKKDNNLDISNNIQDTININHIKLETEITNGVYIPLKGGRYEVVSETELEGYEFYKNINIGKEYNAFVIYARFKEESNKTKLNNFILSYKIKNGNQDEFKDIEIAFSKENIPISDYKIENDNSFISKIDDVELKIYNDNNLYISLFKKNDINFDVTTYNLSEEELIEVLTSIINSI
ncbi:MAG: hypothetical protein E7168_02340 [Firmicutes bacterium]|nr:hypothetical protein [Bacillota bacterium]